VPFNEWPSSKHRAKEQPQQVPIDLVLLMFVYLHNGMIIYKYSEIYSPTSSSNQLPFKGVWLLCFIVRAEP
jgi:hypothetical protein